MDVVMNDISGPIKNGELMTGGGTACFSGAQLHGFRSAVIHGTPV
jgi:hypothetical protein